MTTFRKRNIDIDLMMRIIQELKHIVDSPDQTIEWKTITDEKESIINNLLLKTNEADRKIDDQNKLINELRVMLVVRDDAIKRYHSESLKKDNVISSQSQCVEDLNEELHTLTTQLDCAYKEMGDLKAMKEKLVRERDNPENQQLQDLRIRLRDMESSRDSWKKETESLREELKRTLDQWDNLVVEHSSQGGNVLRLSREVYSLKEELKALKDNPPVEIDILKHELSIKNDLCNKQDQALVRLIDSSETVLKEVLDLRVEKSKLTSQLGVERSANAYMDETITDLKVELDSIGRENTKLKRDNSTLTLLWTTRESALNELQDKVNKLNKIIQDKEKQEAYNE
jgi:hypothetical protein